MAGFIVEDKRKPKKIPWQIHPVIYKVFNANGSGEYSNGITPQTKVNEFIELPLRPLGDPDETLISSALTDVYVKSVNGHSSSHQVKILYQSDMPGAERKAW